ncbi:1,4-dihydroxy-2-naphthoate octaprenyltransferase [Streptohalobacillus salinus]|uniref:1,4-dihydroxy-2-naphthoate octaprenyltransferase n=1 Tax=Streptohalobacillus salinus TaxID=621096 RepID=A0A2V3W3D7_9BACI|nr:1,4-dihydroxy-2-naphthoate polyprenyltransferase [Streptohalobacillus salinus]PXW88450.1 1,4-dihydroxy-2-naphthoate octaprenyltransferase [Streptohalobacillus salinus]
MTIKSFLKLVEIQTKIASVFPFTIGILFVLLRYQELNIVNTLLFFVAMLLFDLATTAINNFMDYLKASTDTYRKTRNIIGQENISTKTVFVTIITLLVTASSIGVVLSFRTDFFVLLIGVICFAIGIFYTFGPIPLSRMPLGEVFSGMTMGFGIIFLAVYVNAYDQGIVHLGLDGPTLIFEANLLLLLEIFLIALPSVLTIANLMLANNICDLEEDIYNHRYTLPYYIGKGVAVKLFNALYVISFIAIIASVIAEIVPSIVLLSLLAGYPVFKQVRLFNRKQEKAETFVVSVKNLVLVNGAVSLSFLLALIIN